MKKNYKYWAIRVIICIGLVIFIIIPNKFIDKETEWYTLLFIAITCLTLYIIGYYLVEKIKSSYELYNELKNVQQMCLKRSIRITKIGEYIDKSKEKSLPKESVILLLVNDVLNYDLSEPAIDTIAHNIFNEKYYIYFFPSDIVDIASHFQKLKEAILRRLEKGVKIEGKEVESSSTTNHYRQIIDKYLKVCIIGQESEYTFNYCLIIQGSGVPKSKKYIACWYKANQESETTEVIDDNMILAVQLDKKEVIVLRNVFERLSKNYSKDDDIHRLIKK